MKIKGKKKGRGTWTCAEGVGWLKLSEMEAMAHMRARIVTAKVSKALALYPNECIFVFFFSYSGSFGFWVSLFDLLLLLRLVLGSVWEKWVIDQKDISFGGFLFRLLCQMKRWCAQKWVEGFHAVIGQDTYCRPTVCADVAFLIFNFYY